MKTQVTEYTCDLCRAKSKKDEKFHAVVWKIHILTVSGTYTEHQYSLEDVCPDCRTFLSAICTEIDDYKKS